MGMASTLVVNPGSSSRKYALYVDGKVEVELRFEQTNTGFEVCSQVRGAQQICEATEKKGFSSSFGCVADEVDAYLARSATGGSLDTIAVRIVAPGSFFQQHAFIDDEYIKRLQERESLAPLHIPVVMREIRQIQSRYPAVRLVAASDSAFHSTMPPCARNYSIPHTDSELHDIYRFGYHGLSVSSIVRRIHAVVGIDPERMVVCHIGNGTSVTAVKKGVSIETTMGFAPSTGVPMGTRAGDIDNAALLELQKVNHWKASEAELYINTNGGLQGLAGESDIRMLLERRAQGDRVAIEALDTFGYHIQKAVAAMTVPLGGLDALVLTATASVRSTELRKIVTSRLQHLGIALSEDRNNLIVGKDGVVSKRNCPVKVVVMRTHEMREMACVATELACR
jgi:acetate kinase